MKIEDLKGHLLTRKANLTQHGQQMTARMLHLENELKLVRHELGASQGACEEIDRTVALLDGKGPS